MDAASPDCVEKRSTALPVCTHDAHREVSFDHVCSEVLRTPNAAHSSVHAGPASGSSDSLLVGSPFGTCRNQSKYGALRVRTSRVALELRVPGCIASPALSLQRLSHTALACCAALRSAKKSGKSTPSHSRQRCTSSDRASRTSSGESSMASRQRGSNRKASHLAFGKASPCGGSRGTLRRPTNHAGGAVRECAPHRTPGQPSSFKWPLFFELFLAWFQ